MVNVLSAAQTAEFNDKGFTYARGLFTPDEVKLLTDAMEQDPAVRSSILDRRDGEGRSTRIALWNRAGDSVYGLAARCRRLVDSSAALLGGPVYHYQSKLTAKEPFVEVDLARINPEGLIMDDKKPDEVASVLEEMHAAGKGIVGMKILGEGRINTPERKDASLRYVLGLGTVDAFIIGFESTEQVDDILKRTTDAIASLKA